MNIWDIFRNAVKRFPDRIGIIDGETRLTYSELERRILTLADFLKSNSIRKGDRISILDFNSHNYFETYYAAAALGAVLNPLNYRLSPGELSYILEDAGSGWLFVSDRFEDHVTTILESGTALEGIVWTGKRPQTGIKVPEFVYEEIIKGESRFDPSEVDTDFPAHLYYTSGTTGKPKGVILTHRNVCVHARGAVEELEISENDHWGHIAPMFHLADAWAVFAVTLVGGCHIILNRFDARNALELIEKERMTISNLIPTMLNLMVREPEMNRFDYSSLRMILSGGAPISPDLVGNIIKCFGCEYVQTYGMTETSPYLTLSLLKPDLKSLPPEEQLAYRARTGRPFKTVELKVVRDDGVEVRPDDKEVGEILVRGETVSPGYWDRPEETEEAFVEGWLKTGDLAVVDSEGYVNIVDRKKDMIICGGENIYSIEVENVLYSHPKVLETAVIGQQDEIWGEKVMAAVVLRSGKNASACEIIEFCKTRLADFKSPKVVVFLEDLPKTGSGKISKKTLRERLTDSKKPE